MKDIIKKEKVFSHPIDKIWRAITQAEEISAWFIHADFKPEVGYKYTFTAPEEHNCAKIKGEVRAATPYKLVYTWIVENTDVETVVSWDLKEVDGKTKLILTHSGISNYPGETAITMLNSFNGGWDNCISGLDNYLLKEVHAV